MARNFVRPPANLFAVENFVYQQFADVLSPPHSNTNCQANSMWLLSYAAEAAKKLTTRAASSSSLI